MKNLKKTKTLNKEAKDGCTYDKCPECGSEKFRVYRQINGDINYDIIGECLGCGYTEST